MFQNRLIQGGFVMHKFCLLGGTEDLFMHLPLYVFIFCSLLKHLKRKEIYYGRKSKRISD